MEFSRFIKLEILPLQRLPLLLLLLRRRRRCRIGRLAAPLLL